MTLATASGKTILLGEHAVVYNRPAIAVPVSDVRATAEVVDAPAGTGIVIMARDINERFRLDDVPSSDAARALQVTIYNVLEHLASADLDLNLYVSVHSQLPIARGMGSGAAIATALVRALAQHLGRSLDFQTVSDLVYQTEVIFHGTPSGIDNTVVAYEKPVYFRRGQSPQVFWAAKPFTLLVGDTGVPSETRDAVASVRRGWQLDQERYESWFDQVGRIVLAGQLAIAQGNLSELGTLMNQNQAILHELGVSSPKLDRLVHVALQAGAGGAKLSGAGMGGCMVALVPSELRDKVTSALLCGGAIQVIPTVVK